MKTDIVVLGSLNVDFVVRTRKRPKSGETVLGTDFRIYPGGKGANQAVAAARAGGKVAMAGRVGDDIFAGILTESLTGAGVNTDLVKVTGGVSTGSAFITIDETGENSIVVVPGANYRCDRKDVDDLWPALSAAKVLLLQLEIPLDTVIYAAQKAHSLGVTVMLDPAPATHLPPEIFSLIDIITPNEHEASFLTGREICDTKSARLGALELLSMGVKAAVIKLGGKGLVYGEKDYFDHIPGHKVDVVDTTAAGDAFSGGLAVAICEGKSLGEACRFANAVAALSVTRVGAQTSMPWREEIDRFLNA
ncbi:MAG TPA: ribokinase [Firmicutes bacterium]|uniref:Ribokinase n=1 Tax=Candidatus Fermentithermobacillus carboniphilus TaxID=3085328 RepID=A0AAT9LDN8_9FIRM|nr:MAG: ribokinase [Candidatus Fermentithermobacillus carboniphilus]HHW17540.1 ribokinase [Candidatus Fermentithermobacillaceae bacterium]